MLCPQRVEPERQRGKCRKAETRPRPSETETDEDTECDTDSEQLVKDAHFDGNGSSDGQAMAARQSSQFKRSGVGGRLIITLAVNI